MIYVCCDDIDSMPRPGSSADKYLDGMATLFSRSNAMEIASAIFIANPEAVICHCDAGQSRSAGAAAAISKFFTGDDSFYFRSGLYRGPKYTPNRLIYRSVLEALYAVKKWRGGS